MTKREFLRSAASASVLAFAGLEAVRATPLESNSSSAEVPSLMQSSTKGLYTIWQANLYFVNHATGEFRKVSNENWAATPFMTTLKGRLYSITGNLLYEINPADGTYKKLSTDSWIGTAYLHGANNELYAISQGKFYRISPADGTFKEIPTKTLEFIGVKNLAWCAGKMYCIAGKLCTIDLQTGAVVAVSNDNWGATGAELFTALGNMLYVINGGTLYSLNPADGAYKKLSEDDWSAATKLVGLDGMLYIAADSAFYGIDPQTGAFKNLGNRRTWKNAYCVTAVE